MTERFPIARRVADAFSDPRVRKAFEFLREREPQIEQDQIRLSMIPAPPFQEQERSRAFAAELGEIGLQPSIDGIGNALAAYDEYGPDPVVVGAHLDTVFPPEQPLQLHRRGRTLFLPGISDNGAGLVAVLWVLRAARYAGLKFRRPVVAIGNVGEEGPGDLRGIRHFFKEFPWKVCDFIAVDGCGLQRITNAALGSRRFRVRMTGPGGHSWADFGRPHPIQAIAAAIHAFAGIVPRPGMAFNVGTIRGGMAVNVIPTDAVMEVDLRSGTAEDLDWLQNHLERSASRNAAEAGVDLQIEQVGDRPLGRTPVETALVQAAVEATRQFGVEPSLDIGSTDANIPMSLGIPAISVGGGGAGGNIHTPEEWFDPTHREAGLQRLFLLVAALAGIEH